MTGSPQDERATLERKDRGELVALANALEVRIPSRAKKAEMVDLLLAAINDTGAGTGEDGGSIDADVARPAPAAETDDGGAGPDDGSDGSDPEAASGEVVAHQASSASGSRRSHPRTGPSGGGEQEAPTPSEQDHEGAGTTATPGQTGDDGGGSTDEHGDGQGEGSTRGRRRRRRNRDRDGEAGGGEFDGEPVAVSGLLDLREDGYGFLRVNGFAPGRDDVYVSVKQIRQLGLRRGDHLSGFARPATHKERNPALIRVESVNGLDPEQAGDRPRFDDLTPLFPDERLHLEGGTIVGDPTGRVIDLIAPIGKGQRGLIVSPPKAGKTTIMKTIAKAIERNHPDVQLIVLLIDERPEEVTDFRRSLKDGEVVASTFDRPAEEHIAVAELTIEHAKRLVEYGRDVVVILDGITRLARAYNLASPGTGRAMSGGLDSGALYPPKRFFGAARNLEEGGSLTIVATALVETGSAMDNVIFEEFKGTGNMELRLDRKAAEQRLYPAIALDASSTRHEELLFSKPQAAQVTKLRRVIGGLAQDGQPLKALEMLLGRLGEFRSNDEFLSEMSNARNG
ncbi:MAG: transcription termination factor Rho [Microthrixaceae bacterium]